MRLEAGVNTHCRWFIWHCTRCCSPKVVWVDDDVNMWGEWFPVERVIKPRQAQKIVILINSCTVFIDPPDDNSQDETLRELVLISKESTL